MSAELYTFIDSPMTTRPYIRPQYAKLQKLWRDYHESSLMVIAIPSAGQCAFITKDSICSGHPRGVANHPQKCPEPAYQEQGGRCLLKAAYDGTAAESTGYGMGWWIDHETGLISDGGTYGSVPWLDLEDGCGPMTLPNPGSACETPSVSTQPGCIECISTSGAHWRPR